jgi:hypothetical protein
VVNHVGAPRQDVEAAACHLALKPLRLAVTNDRVGIAGEDGGRRKQGAVTPAQGLGRCDHVRGILRESAYLGWTHRQADRELCRELW